MSKIGRASLFEQQAQQFSNIITETVSDEDTRSELLADLRTITRRGVEAIMNDAEEGQKRTL